jgi:hypothetical protein
LTFWLKGFYQHEFQKTLIQEQLFSTSSMEQDTACIIHSFMGQDFIDGRLEQSSIVKLTHNVMTHWDESYPLSEFAPCSKFQDLDIDPQESRQTPKEKFDWVPLIQELVN